MERINKAAAVGVVFFSLILAGYVAMKVEQTTIAVLAGAALGLAIAVPTTVIILLVGLRKPDAGTAKAPPAQQPASETHYHYHQHNTINVYVSRRGLSRFDECTEVATALNVSRYKAEQMIEAGEVKLLPPAK